VCTQGSQSLPLGLTLTTASQLGLLTRRFSPYFSESNNIQKYGKISFASLPFRPIIRLR
jgi:hypothetical protein